jgi:hypothetical protein
MVTGERAEAPVPCSDVCFRLDQMTGNFKEAFDSTTMQRRVSTEQKKQKKKKKKQLSCANRVIKTIIITTHKSNNKDKGGGSYPSFFASTSALHCSKRRQTSRWPFIAE